MKTCVILPAAGTSTRFDNREKKQFIELDGRPVWQRTVELFCTREDVCQILLVINPDDNEMVRRRYGANLAFMNVQLVDGGKERCLSVENALGKVIEEATHVAIHDAVRPCVTTQQIDAVFQAALAHGAAILATPLVHTLKKDQGTGRTLETLPRKDLWLAQTPQVFAKNIIQAAYQGRKNDFFPTDDSQMVESTGLPVRLVTCGLENLKITTAEDLRLADCILKSRPKPKPKQFHPFADDL